VAPEKILPPRNCKIALFKPRASRYQIGEQFSSTYNWRTIQQHVQLANNSAVRTIGEQFSSTYNWRTIQQYVKLANNSAVRAIGEQFSSTCNWRTIQQYVKLANNSAVRTVGEQFSSTYKPAAIGDTPANGFRATSYFPCDQNIFRPPVLPVVSEDTDAAPVSHLALVKTSHQPSFNSVNFSPFNSAGVPRAPGTSRVQSLNLQPNTKQPTTCTRVCCF